MLPVENLSEDSKKLFDVLNKQDDLAVVMVTASYLDAALAAMLHRFFIESSISDRLLDVHGPVGTLSARADLCYALTLIDKFLYQDLVRILEIRNMMAHSHLAMDFTTREVARVCGKFSFVRSVVDAGTNGPPMLADYMYGPRNQFVLTAVMISQRLLLTGLGVKRQGSVAERATPACEGSIISGLSGKPRAPAAATVSARDSRRPQPATASSFAVPAIRTAGLMLAGPAIETCRTLANTTCVPRWTALSPKPRARTTDLPASAECRQLR